MKFSRLQYSFLSLILALTLLPPFLAWSWSIIPKARELEKQESRSALDCGTDFSTDISPPLDLSEWAGGNH